VEKELIKAQTARKEMLIEEEKLSSQKQTILSIKRQKAIEQELKECNSNILKFTKYLKQYKD